MPVSTRAGTQLKGAGHEPEYEEQVEGAIVAMPKGKGKAKGKAKPNASAAAPKAKAKGKARAVKQEQSDLKNAEETAAKNDSNSIDSILAGGGCPKPIRDFLQTLQSQGCIQMDRSVLDTIDREQRSKLFSALNTHLKALPDAGQQLSSRET